MQGYGYAFIMAEVKPHYHPSACGINHESKLTEHNKREATVVTSRGFAVKIFFRIRLTRKVARVA